MKYFKFWHHIFHPIIFQLLFSCFGDQSQPYLSYPIFVIPKVKLPADLKYLNTLLRASSPFLFCMLPKKSLPTQALGSQLHNLPQPTSKQSTDRGAQTPLPRHQRVKGFRLGTDDRIKVHFLAYSILAL